jgi:hypothetical protein
MADDKPIIRFYTMGEAVDGDCACPDAVASPQVRVSGEPFMAEQDCACPGAALTPPPPPLQAGQWHRCPELYRAPLVDQHEIVFAPLPWSRIAVLNAAASRVLDAFALPCRLSQVVTALPELDGDEVTTTALLLANHGMIESCGE